MTTSGMRHVDRHRTCLIAVLLCGAASGAGAQTTAPSGALPQSLPEIVTAPTIDGDLGESEWEGTAQVHLPFEIQPAVNGRAPVATHCWMAKDAEHLYVGCRSDDPAPSAIRAQFTDRDDANAHDRITLVLDPFDDGQRGFVFSVSAAGVQTDGILDQARGETDLSWNAIWESGGRITSTGYEVEFAIPFRSLRYPSRSADGLWRFYLEREWPRSEAITLRSVRRDPDDRCALCSAQRFAPGAIVRPGTDIEAVPAVTAARTERRPVHGAPFAGGSIEPDAGIDVRWGATSGSALNLTVNPDFSQIEADAPQLETNARFALSVPERRPFFLEGAELFRTPMPALFTRAIADPIVGAKYAGRWGPLAGGVLFARDETTRLLIPGSAGSSSAGIDGASHAWASRVTHSSSERFVAGGLLTHRTAASYANTVAGLDAYVRPLRALELRVQALTTATRYPEAIAAEHAGSGQRFRGNAFHGETRYRTRNWRARTLLQSVDPTFRADLGFMPEVDSRRAEGSITRRVWGDDIAWLTWLEASIGAWNSQTHEGVLKEKGIWSEVSFQGPFQSTLGINPFRAIERHANAEYDRSGINVGVSAEPTADIRVGIDARRVDVVDYANQRGALLRELRGQTDVRVGRRLSVEVSAGRRTIRHAGLLVTGETIVRIRPVIGLSSRAFLSVLAQAGRVERDARAHAVEVRGRETTVESQVLFTYRLDGQTALRMGYSDLASDVGPDLLTRALERQNRTWFMKLSYAWRP